MQLPICRLTDNDYSKVLDVWELSVKATHHFLKPEEIDYYRPLILKYTLPQVDLYGIKNTQQELLAFIAIRDNKIEMLFVHPDYLRQKLGSSLLSLAIHEHKCNRIDVNEENPDAFKVYQKFGFKPIARHPTDDCGKPHPIIELALT